MRIILRRSDILVRKHLRIPDVPGIVNVVDVAVDAGGSMDVRL